MKITTVDRLHTQLRDMLYETAEILEAHEVRYFLCAGTALGAVRHGDLIPWDFDVDLLIGVGDYQRACRALRAELGSVYAVSDPWNESDYEHLFARVHLRDVGHKFAHIDLFPLCSTSRFRSFQEIQQRFSKSMRVIYYYAKKAGRRSDVNSLSARANVAATIFSVLVRYAFWRRMNKARRKGASLLTNGASGYGIRESFPSRFFEGDELAPFGSREMPVPSPVEEYLTVIYGEYAKCPSGDEQRRQFRFFEDWYLPELQQVDLLTRSGPV